VQWEVDYDKVVLAIIWDLIFRGLVMICSEVTTVVIKIWDTYRTLLHNHNDMTNKGGFIYTMHLMM